MLIFIPFIGFSLALILCAILRKRSFKELLLFVGGIGLCSYIWIIITAGFGHYDKWLIPVIYGLSYGVGCFLIFTLSIRVLKSRLAFALFSFIATALLIYLNIASAENMNLSKRIGGYDLYSNGNVTNVGIIYEALTPIGLMTLYAVSLFATSYIKQRFLTKNNNL